MKTMDLIKQFIRQYFYILGLLVIGSALLVDPSKINREYILLCMAFAAVGDLPIFVYWSRSELSEKALRVRAVIHFILLEAAVLTFGGISGLVTDLQGYFYFCIQVAIISVLVRLVSWSGDVRTANKINEKLKHMKDSGKDE
jgi:hypothetical protein